MPTVGKADNPYVDLLNSEVRESTRALFPPPNLYSNSPHSPSSPQKLQVDEKALEEVREMSKLATMKAKSR